METVPKYTFAEVTEIANYILKGTKYRPELGIICGTGFGDVVEQLKCVNKFEYEAIPNFPVTTVVGHPGRIVFGILGETPVMVMQGRFHYYEGYPLAICVMPVRLMKVLGISHLIVTSSAGALNSDYNAGDIMIIKDHLNLQGMAGNSPLRGANDQHFGIRFPPMANAYNKELYNIAKCVAKQMGMEKKFRCGVYGCVGGPNYTTTAEARMLSIMGADAIGTSTAHEVIAARHCGMTVFGVSLITIKRSLDDDVEEENVCIKQEIKDMCGEFLCRLINSYSKPCSE